MDEQFDQIQNLLKQVSGDIATMGDNTSEQFDDMLSIMDDLAANIIAVQAVIAQLVKNADIDTDALEAWITKNAVGEDGGKGSEKAVLLAKNLVDSNK